MDYGHVSALEGGGEGLPNVSQGVTVCAERVQLLVAGAQRIVRLQRVAVFVKHTCFISY